MDRGHFYTMSRNGAPGLPPTLWVFSCSQPKMPYLHGMDILYPEYGQVYPISSTWRWLGPSRLSILGGFGVPDMHVVDCSSLSQLNFTDAGKVLLRPELGVCTDRKSLTKVPWGATRRRQIELTSKFEARWGARRLLKKHHRGQWWKAKLMIKKRMSESFTPSTTSGLEEATPGGAWRIIRSWDSGGSFVRTVPSKDVAVEPWTRLRLRPSLISPHGSFCMPGHDPKGQTQSIHLGDRRKIARAFYGGDGALKYLKWKKAVQAQEVPGQIQRVGERLQVEACMRRLFSPPDSDEYAMSSTEQPMVSCTTNWPEVSESFGV